MLFSSSNSDRSDRFRGLRIVLGLFASEKDELATDLH